MKNLQKGPLIISGNAHNQLAKDIATYIGQDLTKSEVFKFINPKEQSSCGCGVSINFDLEQVEIDKSKIFAIEV